MATLLAVHSVAMAQQEAAPGLERVFPERLVTSVSSVDRLVSSCVRVKSIHPKRHPRELPEQPLRQWEAVSEGGSAEESRVLRRGTQSRATRT